MKHQKGFTLVELIIVIIILGILAAYAVPKFINMEKTARIATIQGIAGTLQATAAMVHGIAVVNGTTGSAGNVSIDAAGTKVQVAYAYPTADYAGIGSAISNTTSGSGLNNGTFGSYYELYFTADTCSAGYAAATASGGQPTIVANTSGC